MCRVNQLFFKWKEPPSKWPPRNQPRLCCCFLSCSWQNTGISPVCPRSPWLCFIVVPLPCSLVKPLKKIKNMMMNFVRTSITMQHLCDFWQTLVFSSAQCASLFEVIKSCLSSIGWDKITLSTPFKPQAPCSENSSSDQNNVVCEWPTVHIQKVLLASATPRFVH